MGSNVLGPSHTDVETSWRPTRNHQSGGKKYIFPNWLVRGCWQSLGNWLLKTESYSLSGNHQSPVFIPWPVGEWLQEVVYCHWEKLAGRLCSSSSFSALTFRGQHSKLPAPISTYPYPLLSRQPSSLTMNLPLFFLHLQHPEYLIRETWIVSAADMEISLENTNMEEKCKILGTRCLN